MKGNESHCVPNFANFVPKTLLYISIENENECNKVVIEESGVQFWSEIILVISNRSRAAHTFDFEITRIISDQISLHSVQLPLLIVLILNEVHVPRFDATRTVEASNMAVLVLFRII